MPTVISTSEGTWTTEIREVDGLPQGAIIEAFEPAANTPMFNERTVRDKLAAAITYFGDKGQTSGFSYMSLTNAQRDAHMRRVNSAIEGLARLARQSFDAAGD